MVVPPADGLSGAVGDTVRRHLRTMDEDGFVVIEGLLGEDELRAMRAALSPHLRGEHFGRNPFEGERTERVYTLPARGARFAALAEHPLILALCDALLSPNYLLTAAQAINIHPGERPQALHFDDGFYQQARPRRAISISTIWTVDPFTAENGATEVIAGSHRWGDEIPPEPVSAAHFAQRRMAYGRGSAPPTAEVMAPRPNTTPPHDAALTTVRMPAGAVVVFPGTLWHRGGANRSDAPRLALSTQYCEPWARQQENFVLAVPPATARGFSDRLQELLGYSIHPPFMGHAGGLHPKRHLLGS